MVLLNFYHQITVNGLEHERQQRLELSYAMLKQATGRTAIDAAVELAATDLRHAANSYAIPKMIHYMGKGAIDPSGGLTGLIEDLASAQYYLIFRGYPAEPSYIWNSTGITPGAPLEAIYRYFAPVFTAINKQ